MSNYNDLTVFSTLLVLPFTKLAFFRVRFVITTTFKATWINRFSLLKATRSLTFSATIRKAMIIRLFLTFRFLVDFILSLNLHCVCLRLLRCCYLLLVSIELMALTRHFLRIHRLLVHIIKVMVCMLVLHIVWILGIKRLFKQSLILIFMGAKLIINFA
jgi:hypothetical protein